MCFAQSVGINATGVAPNQSAMLDIKSTSSGLLIPRMTTEDRNNITAPIPESLLIFNTTTNCFEWWDAVGSAWVSMSCGSVPLACGDQVWMAVNMNTGTQVTQVTTQGAGQKWCYNDVVANCTTYGGLYQWASAMNLPSSANSTLQYGAGLPNCDPCGGSGIQGICPAGYHIPTDLEWSRYEYCIENTIAPTGSTTLATFQTSTGWRGTNSTAGPGAKLKVTSGDSPAWDGTNTSGFSALPTGNSGDGVSNSMDTGTGFRAVTENDATSVWGRGLESGFAQSFRAAASKTGGYSVRCLQN